MFLLKLMMLLVAFDCPKGSQPKERVVGGVTEKWCEVRNEKVGGYRSFYASGLTDVSGSFDRNGHRTSKWHWYFPDGTQRQVGSYEHGEEVGLWKAWYENGVTKSIEFYVEGYPSIVTYFSHTGEVASSFSMPTSASTFHGVRSVHENSEAGICAPPPSIEVLRILYSAQNDDRKAIASAIARSADLNVFDQFGRTPLFMAASAGQLTIVKMLVKAGANPTIRTCLGVSPLMAAKRHHHTDVAKYLAELK